MAAASEFDTVAKKICKAIYPSQKPSKLPDYHPIITSKYPKFLQYEILIPRYKLSFQPWITWQISTDAIKSPVSPDWWKKGYNKIKHERDTNFEQANLENAILATCGLLTGILYFYDAHFRTNRPEIDISQTPKFLSPKDYNQPGWESAKIIWKYTLLK
ncbi:MAG: hypothetical protein QNJ47_28435 [Nostocaceae cyanobacterium]|nr:hypothetical protein [Nostocaceae cyanobacterium]